MGSVGEGDDCLTELQAYLLMQCHSMTRRTMVHNISETTRHASPSTILQSLT